MQDQNWNINLVQNLFPHYIAQEILAIPISTDLRQDSRYWIHDPKGKYSVRDDYKLDIGFFDSPRFCFELQVSKTWKLLWSLTLPPKVRIFWWRVLHNIIPTEANLKSHHVPIQESCKLCHFHADTTCHVLFWCDESKKRWKGTIFKPILKQDRNMDIMDVFNWMKK